ncbi:hypothetical protein DICVIV_03951 [Dictyocaulus viviparus]|uniref:P-type ATPase C-terminal domain-containing protein n=1 Tax=Dictyocaulus viviparus TaxID=29172 RepID=A0A0D8Y5S5_DICVI|nr:hypothetical protein DICVIV_03951 [Dictyocaulus viviparus]
MKRIIFPCNIILDAIKCLDYILLDEEDRDRFLRLALCCSAVICCRCTPIQKAAVTRLVKANVNGVVLAIGDGANDVAMLQINKYWDKYGEIFSDMQSDQKEADVGIGIAGQEGMQASLASDYTITQSIFTYFNGYSVQTIAYEWTVLLYNMFFTSFPALVMGAIDRPAPINSLIKYPQIYHYYQNSLSNMGQFRWCICGVVQAMIIFWVNYFNWGEGAPMHFGQDSSLWVFGIFVYWCLYISLFSTAIGGILFMVPLQSIFFVIILVVVAALVPDVAFKVLSESLAVRQSFVSAGQFHACTEKFRRMLRADMQDAMLWQEGFRGPNFNILYQPIFKMCDIVGLKTYGELENGFAFAQDDGLAVMQMDLLQRYSDDVDNTMSTALLESPKASKQNRISEIRTSKVPVKRELFAEAYSVVEGTKKVKALERSVDDKTVESTSMKSPSNL